MAEMIATAAFEQLVAGAVEYVPLIFYATVLLVSGYILGRIVYSVVDRVLEHTQVDEYFEEEGHLELQLSNLFAELSKWVIYFVFLQQAAQTLGISALTNLVDKIVNWIPGVIGAIAVFLAGYGIAIYTKDHIVGSETLYADLLGKTIFFFVIYIAAAMALDIPQGINPTLLNNILLIIVASLGLAFAIAAGWGLKDVVREEARKYIDDQS